MQTNSRSAWAVQYNMSQLKAASARQEITTDDPWVRGRLTFVVDDPGRQAVGSFNPITEGDWTAGAVRATFTPCTPLLLYNSTNNTST